MTRRPGPTVPKAAAATLSAWSKFIDATLDEYFVWHEAHSWEPQDPSPSLNERAVMCRQIGPAGAWDGSHSENVKGISSTLLHVASQYLEALRPLLDSHQVIVSLPPLVRSTFEACCRITWLLEPFEPAGFPTFCHTPARPRGARVALIQLEDLGRLKTASAALKDPRAPKYGKQWSDFRKISIPGWYYPSEIDYDRRGNLVLCGQSLPGLKEGATLYERILRQDWRADGVYDFLSNATHPTPHVALIVTKPSADGRRRRFEIDDISYLTRLVRLAVVPFLQAWQITAIYHGWSVDGVEDLMDRLEELPGTR